MTSAPAGAPSRNCVSCGRAISWDANVCPFCGHDFRVAMAGPMAQKKETALPLAGGILIILGSLIYLVIGAIMVGAGSVVWNWFDEGSAAAVACGAIVLVVGIISILGGIFSLQRRQFALALVAGIFTIPTVLGLIGMILVVVAKDEFK